MKHSHSTVVANLESAAVAELDRCGYCRTCRVRLRDARQTFRTVSQRNGGGRNPYLITREESSAKLSHNDSDAWRQGVVYLSPHRLSGVNLCTSSTRGCRIGCLGTTAGRLQFDPSQTAQYVRSRFLIDHPADFVTVLRAEIHDAAWESARMGKRFALRCNGTSDLMIERADTFLDVCRLAGVDRFVDYTKHPGRRGWIRDDYYVAASVSERTASDEVKAGSVVVVDVRRGEPLPETYNGHPATDGDTAVGDLRFLDPPDAVVLLRAKGALAKVAGTPAGMVKPAGGY